MYIPQDYKGEAVPQMADKAVCEHGTATLQDTLCRHRGVWAVRVDLTGDRARWAMRLDTIEGLLARHHGNARIELVAEDDLIYLVFVPTRVSRQSEQRQAINLKTAVRKLLVQIERQYSRKSEPAKEETQSARRAKRNLETGRRTSA